MIIVTLQPRLPLAGVRVNYFNTIAWVENDAITQLYSCVATALVPGVVTSTRYCTSSVHISAFFDGRKLPI